MMWRIDILEIKIPMYLLCGDGQGDREKSHEEEKCGGL